jgi:hypothetical protein
MAMNIPSPSKDITFPRRLFVSLAPKHSMNQLVGMVNKTYPNTPSSFLVTSPLRCRMDVDISRFY